MRRIVRVLGRVEGAEIAEAALVLPLVFMFLLGIVWFGRAFNIYSTITQAAERASTSKITICRSVWLNSPSTPAQCGVIVSFQYPFKVYLPFTSLSMQQVNLTAEAQSRMEN